MTGSSDDDGFGVVLVIIVVVIVGGGGIIWRRIRGFATLEQFATQTLNEEICMRENCD